MGAACPPALIFVALGVAAFSAVSAVVYAVTWLSRDYNLYKAKIAANDPEVIDRVRKDAHSLYATEETKSYFSYCINRLAKWAGEHPGQAIAMGVGFALFVTALVITALAFTGGLAAVPVLAGFIGGIGASGTALGTVGAVFTGALGSSAIATTLASIFAGATLILAPVNILDTIRRFVSGVYEKDSPTTVPPQVIFPPPPPPPADGVIPAYQLPRTLIPDAPPPPRDGRIPARQILTEEQKAQNLLMERQEEEKEKERTQKRMNEKYGDLLLKNPEKPSQNPKDVSLGNGRPRSYSTNK